MRLVAPSPLAPAWPPLLATRGPGRRSALHAHHAMHVVVALEGELAVRTAARGRWARAAGVLTAPDVAHQIDAAGREVLLVFLDPESAAGATLAAALTGPVRLIAGRERATLDLDASPELLMRADGAAWVERAVAALGVADPAAGRRRMHPRVRRLIRLVAALPPEAPVSLAALAAQVGLSPGRLMHAFTSSVGIPLRPYLAWLRLQRAAAEIVAGRPLAQAAAAAGFADAAHMSRTFRRMLGVPPSGLAR